tara:strand:- start:1369 stop:2331 length:963 start_codon:yes stop_codon:yes gene_type:complete
MKDQQTAIQSRKRQSHGYVLVLALLLIAMAASVLAIMARRSIFDASDVLNAQTNLQHRWAAYSLEKSLLPHASKVMQTLLEKQEQPQDKEPVTKVDFQLTLGGNAYQLTLSDEQSKANINQLLKNKGDAIQTAQAIRSLLNDAQISDIPNISLSPHIWTNDPSSQSIQTLGQVFDSTTPQELCPFEAQNPCVMDFLTCWGDGKLNLHTAPEQVIKAVCIPLLGRGQIQKLLTARQGNPQLKIDKALTDAGVAKDQIEKVKPLFTDQSNCYALWTRWETNRMTKQRLGIAQATAKKSPGNKAPESQNAPEKDKLNYLIFEW